MATTTAARDVKRSSLQRVNTFEVFDEDANTESPTVSQRSNEVDETGILLFYLFIYLFHSFTGAHS